MPGRRGEVDETGVVVHPYWPLFDIRVRTPRLELRPPTDEDLVALVDLIRRGIHEPTMMPFSNPWTDTPSPWLERQALQWNWRQRADWTKEGWGLGFAVVLRDPEPTIVGVQDIFAKNFHLTGVAESGSWLGMEHQGKGIGKEMRAAILHFGFAGLRARWLETFAWEDNASSLGVTERLGYEPNGVEMDLRRNQGQVLRRYRMTRETWEQQRRRDIRIEGLERCLDMFGLPQAVAGADACRGGWCVVTLPVDGDATVEVVDRFTKVATRQAMGQLGAVGVDIPIGLSEGPPRECDIEARALLGDRRSSVFSAPVRPVLGAAVLRAGPPSVPVGRRGRPVEAVVEPRAQGRRGRPPARPDPTGQHLRMPSRGGLRRGSRRPDGAPQEGPAGPGRTPGHPPATRPRHRCARGRAAERGRG